MTLQRSLDSQKNDGGITPEELYGDVVMMMATFLNTIQECYRQRAILEVFGHWEKYEDYLETRGQLVSIIKQLKQFTHQVETIKKDDENARSKWTITVLEHIDDFDQLNDRFTEIRPAILNRKVQKEFNAVRSYLRSDILTLFKNCQAGLKLCANLEKVESLQSVMSDIFGGKEYYQQYQNIQFEVANLYDELETFHNQIKDINQLNSIERNALYQNISRWFDRFSNVKNSYKIVYERFMDVLPQEELRLIKDNFLDQLCTLEVDINGITNSSVPLQAFCEQTSFNESTSDSIAPTHQVGFFEQRQSSDQIQSTEGDKNSAQNKFQP